MTPASSSVVATSKELTIWKKLPGAPTGASGGSSSAPSLMYVTDSTSSSDGDTTTTASGPTHVTHSASLKLSLSCHLLAMTTKRTPSPMISMSAFPIPWYASDVFVPYWEARDPMESGVTPHASPGVMPSFHSSTLTLPKRTCLIIASTHNHA